MYDEYTLAADSANPNTKHNKCWLTEADNHMNHHQLIIQNMVLVCFELKALAKSCSSYPLGYESSSILGNELYVYE